MIFSEQCYEIRAELKQVAAKVRKLSDELKIDVVSTGSKFTPPADVEEMFVNVSLAYRHLEDAIMRMGKAVQAFDGGASAYPR